MKKLGLAFVLFLWGQLSFAQAWEGKGDQKFQAGISGFGYGQGIAVTYDYGLSDVISLGAGANFYFSDYKEDRKTFIFGRLNFHLQDALNLPREWDIYPGIDVGNGFGAHIGARYFFSNNLGAFLEVGNNGSIGLSFNF